MTPPEPGGPGWPPPAPGAEPQPQDRPAWPPPPGAEPRSYDRRAWLQRPPPGPQGWSPGPPPPGRPRRRVGGLTAALVLLLVVGLAVGGLVVATRRDRPATSASGATAGPPSTQAPATRPPATRAPAATPTGPGVQAVEQDVAELRELRFRRRVPVAVESPAKLARRLLETLAADTDEGELRRQGRAMVLLGELPAGTDLPRLLNRVQAESVLGFYVPGRRPPKGRLYVRSNRGLDPYAKIILAHELTHAVTDQRFDLTRADRLAAGTGNEDQLAAYSALVEGDATLLMQRYLAERLTPA
ncbi:MAG TPA: hypothetical protein VG673_17230, partial [Actinomycetota bacterium]|nr:hypothetical protein [Actinomycetota bacterium]